MRQVLIAAFFLPLIATAQYRPQLKNSYGVTLSLPWLNSFAFYDHESQKSASRAGFMGINASIYYKTDRDKISTSIGVLGCAPVPIGPYDPDYEDYKQVYGHYIEATWHRRIRSRLNLIAGLNYVEYGYSSWKDRINSYNVTEYTGGLTTGAEYLFRLENLSLALFYRPSLVTFTGLKKYRHIISLDARIDINMFRSK